MPYLRAEGVVKVPASTVASGHCRHGHVGLPHVSVLGAATALEIKKKCVPPATCVCQCVGSMQGAPFHCSVASGSYNEAPRQELLRV